MTNVEKALLDLGFDNSLTGTNIIARAVGFVVDDPSAARRAIQEAYIPAAMELYGEDDQFRISRNVNYAIRKATVDGNFARRCEKLEKKWGADGLFGLVITDNNSIVPKKLIVKLAALLGDAWNKEA